MTLYMFPRTHQALFASPHDPPSGAMAVTTTITAGGAGATVHAAAGDDITEQHDTQQQAPDAGGAAEAGADEADGGIGAAADGEEEDGASSTGGRSAARASAEVRFVSTRNFMKLEGASTASATNPRITERAGDFAAAYATKHSHVPPTPLPLPATCSPARWRRACGSHGTWGRCTCCVTRRASCWTQRWGVGWWAAACTNAHEHNLASARAVANSRVHTHLCPQGSMPPAMPCSPLPPPGAPTNLRPWRSSQNCPRTRPAASRRRPSCARWASQTARGLTLSWKRSQRGSSQVGALRMFFSPLRGAGGHGRRRLTERE